MIFGNLPVPANVVSNLLAGFTYMNIHTALNPAGEIRGQLIASLNSPPMVTCAPNGFVGCGTRSLLTAVVSDPDDDALTVVWTLNGTAMQTNSLLAGSTSNPTDVSFTATLPLGTNLIGVLATDSATNTASCATTIVVVDTTTPVISNVRAVPNVLWPPNHQFVNVRFFADATDTCGPATWKIIGVTSSEDVKAPGSGHTSPDWIITGDHAVKLRAERSGQGDGRVYTITVQAKDVSGNLSEIKTVTVTVPKSQGHDKGKGK